MPAPAVAPLVEGARRAIAEVGGNEAGVGPLGAGLDPGDDPLDPAPAAGAVVELLVAAQLVGPGHGDAPGGGALLQRHDMVAQRRGRGDAEDEIQTLGAAEIEHLRRTIVTVRPDQDLHLRPVAADLARQPAQESTGLA